MNNNIWDHSYHYQFWIGAYGLCTIPVCLILLILFIRRRMYQPIKARLILYTVILSILLIIGICLVSLKLIYLNDINCEEEILLISCVTSFIGVSYIINGWYNFFKFGLANDRMRLYAAPIFGDQNDRRRRTLHQFVESYDSGELTKSSKYFFLKHSNLLQPIIYIPIILLMLVLHLSIVIFQYLFGSYDGNYLDNTCTDGTKLLYKLLHLPPLIYISILLYFAKNMPKKFNHIGIRYEFINIGILSTIAIIINFVFIMWDVREDLLDFGSIFGLLTLQYCFYVSYVQPLKRTYIIEEQQSDGKILLQEAMGDNEASEWTTFQSVCNMPGGFEAFADFLASEYSLENLLFWNDIVMYKKSFEVKSSDESKVSLDEENNDEKDDNQNLLPARKESVSHRRSVSTASNAVASVSRSYANKNIGAFEIYNWCNDLYYTYIKPNSPFEVNLPSWIVSALTEKFDKKSSNDDNKKKADDENTEKKTMKPQMLRASSSGPDGKGPYQSKDAIALDDVTAMTRDMSKSVGAAKYSGEESVRSSRAPSTNIQLMSLNELKIVWDDAFQNIEGLIAQDSFSRFTAQSKFMKTIREELQRKAKTKEMLVKAELI